MLINKPDFELLVSPVTVTESDFKLSSCPVPVNEFNFELSACPVLIREFACGLSDRSVVTRGNIDGLPMFPASVLESVHVLCFSVFPRSLSLAGVSAPPWRSSAPPWWLDVWLWWSSALPWWSSAPSPLHWWAPALSAPPWRSSAPPWWSSARSPLHWSAPALSAPPWRSSALHGGQLSGSGGLLLCRGDLLPGLLCTGGLLLCLLHRGGWMSGSGGLLLHRDGLLLCCGGPLFHLYCRIRPGFLLCQLHPGSRFLGILLCWLCLSHLSLHLHMDLAVHSSPCSASTPPPSCTIWGASGSTP